MRSFREFLKFKNRSHSGAMSEVFSMGINTELVIFVWLSLLRVLTQNQKNLSNCPRNLDFKKKWKKRPKILETSKIYFFFGKFI